MIGGKIVCPCGKDPRVIANAKKEYAAYKTRHAAWFHSRSDKRNGRQKKPRQAQPLDFSRLSAVNQNRMREAVLATNAATRPAAPAQSPVIYIYMLTVSLGGLAGPCYE